MKNKFYFLIALSWCSITAFGQTVTTFAGSVRGSTDGTGTAASFSTPMGVAVDASGNVYVADQNNYKIRKITSAGEVSTLAGSTTYGSTDAAGAAASFKGPIAVAVDGSGNVYVADYNNNTIRKVTSTGVVSTLAGSGTAGSTDGTGAAASFYSPTGVAVDASGNVYVADTYNNTIRKITSTGEVSTLAGSTTSGSTDGTGVAASFYHPSGVAVDASGNVYVGDSGNNKIRKITSAGEVSTLAGSGATGGTDATGAAASFNYPRGVAVDAYGQVYVGDSGNRKIRKITSAGVVSTLAGSGTAGSTDGTGTAASFNYPVGVAVDASGNVYVTEANSNKIRKITQVLATANFELNDKVKIYPNPTHGNVTIELNELKKASLEVISILGKAVMKQSLNANSNAVTIEKLPVGTYLFKISSDEGTATSKVIKN